MTRLRAKRCVWSILVGACSIALVGAIFEFSATAMARAQGYAGKLVDIGGYRLYLHCRGTGAPTIIFDSGLGDASDVWRDLHGRAADMSRACVYDRAGLGWSDPGQRPRSARQMAVELHELLHAGGEAPPYLLVAHSMAGYIARVYASEHRSEVAGLLLLDVSHPDQDSLESPAAVRDRADFIERQRLWARLAPFGITRALGHCEWSPQDCGRSYWTTIDEFDPFTTISPAQVRATGPFSALPLVVLAHDPELAIRDDPSDSGRHDAKVDLQMQRQLTGLSALGCFVVASRSRHYVQDDRPDLVLRSLSGMVQQIRHPDQDAGLCSELASLGAR